MASNKEEEGIRVLILDAGDIRCLSQLDILDEFLYQVQWKRKCEVIPPCEYFDVISATGPAGLLVALLVIIRLPIQEAKEEFIKIWLAVFADKDCDSATRSTSLENELKDLLRRNGIGEDALLLQDETEGQCKGFVCTASPEASQTCRLLRTYRSRERDAKATIVEAILATCAIPELFTSVKVGPPLQAREYITCDRVHNNPTRVAIKEIHDVYGTKQKVACVLSLGCGKPSIAQARALGRLDYFKLSCLSANQVANELDAQLGMSHIYHRFSVEQGLESLDSISMDRLGEIGSLTRAYLLESKTAREMEKCVAASEQASLAVMRDIYQLPTKALATTHGLPPLCSSFVMRQELMDSMSDAMFDSIHNPEHVLVLSGMGGSGKTQMVSKFARTHADRFQHILFVDASSISNIENGILSKVRSLGAACRTVEEAREYLLQPENFTSGPWMLVLDNVDDPNIELGPFLVLCEHGYTIITTRNPALRALASNSSIDVDIMTESEALEVLLRAAFPSVSQATEADHNHGKEIVKALGYLPVALVQAGSFIRQWKCMDKYLSYLGKNRLKILHTPAKAQLDKHHHGIYAALDITLPVLSPRAKELLGLLACFNYAGFPLELIARGAHHQFMYQPHDLLETSPELSDIAQFLQDLFCPGGEWDEFNLVELLVELEQYSLVVRVEVYAMVTLRFHPLVHAWMRDRVSAINVKKYEDAGLRLLINGTAEEDEDIYEFIVPHINSLSSPLQTAHVNDLGGVARLVQWDGKRDQSLEMWTRICSDVSTRNGEQHLRTNRAKLQLALAHGTQTWENWKALSLVQEVLSHYATSLSQDHPEVMEANIYLSELKLHDLWIQDSDITFQQTVADFWLEYEGDRAALLAPKAMEVLAKMCRRQGHLKRANEYLLSALRLREQRQGPDHLMTIKTKEQLAVLQSEMKMRQGKVKSIMSFNAEEKLLEDVVAQRKKLRGYNHDKTLKAQSTLANFYIERKEYQKAECTLKEIVHGWSSRSMPYCTVALQAMHQLSSVYKHQKLYDKLSDQLKLIIQAPVSRDGTYALESLAAMEELAQLYQTQQDQDSLIAQLQLLILAYSNMGSNYSQKLLDTSEFLAKIYEKQGSYQKAIGQLKLLVDAQRKEDTRNVKEAWPSKRSNFIWPVAKTRHKFKHFQFMEDLTRLYEHESMYDEAISLWYGDVDGKEFVPWMIQQHHQITTTIHMQQEQSDKTASEQAEIIRHFSGPFSGPVEYLINSLIGVYETQIGRGEIPSSWKIIELGHPSNMGYLAQRYAYSGLYGGAIAQWLVIYRHRESKHGTHALIALKAKARLAHLHQRNNSPEAASTIWEELLADETFLGWQAHCDQHVRLHPDQTLGDGVVGPWARFIRRNSKQAAPLDRQSFNYLLLLAEAYQRVGNSEDAMLVWYKAWNGNRSRGYEDAETKLWLEDHNGGVDEIQLESLLQPADNDSD